RLSPSDIRAIIAHNFRTCVDLGAKTFNKMRRAFPSLQDLDTLHKIQARIAQLSGITPELYPRCPRKECCLIAGSYEAQHECPYCNASIYNKWGKPHAVFEYFPILPRLNAMFRNPETAKLLSQYRAEYKPHANTIEDVFDSLHYRRLRRRPVNVKDEVFSHCFFDQDTDIALGLSADGVCPSKNKKQTC
ncbi:hypothetical protein BDV98DRAFT_493869, partial [Pterulicium gracile]